MSGILRAVLKSFYPICVISNRIITATPLKKKANDQMDSYSFVGK